MKNRIIPNIGIIEGEMDEDKIFRQDRLFNLFSACAISFAIFGLVVSEPLGSEIRYAPAIPVERTTRPAYQNYFADKFNREFHTDLSYQNITNKLNNLNFRVSDREGDKK